MATSAASVEPKQGTHTGDTGPSQGHQPLFDKEVDCLARERYRRLYFQITDEHVASFDHIAKAWWISHNPDKPPKDDQEKRVSQFLEYEARKTFRKKYGDIEREYWNQKPFAGCALTSDGRVHSVMNVTEPKLVLYEDLVHQLGRDAYRTFEQAAHWNKKAANKARQNLNEIGEMLYVVLARLILAASVLDDEDEDEDVQDKAVKALRIEWESAQASVNEMIQRQARFEYFTGVGLGALITIPAMAAVGWASMRYATNVLNEPGEPASLTAAIIGGAAGAVISVTQRMTTRARNPLVIDFTAPKLQKIVLGALRPIVGAVFGAVVYFAIIGGLLALQANTSKDASIASAFFAVAGFAAGFSERFATDVLQRASSGILPTTQATQPVEKPDEFSMLPTSPRHAETTTVPGEHSAPARQRPAGENAEAEPPSS